VSGTRRSKRAGQAMLEYVLVFIAVLGLVAVIVLFARAARRTAVDTAELVTADMP